MNERSSNNVWCTLLKNKCKHLRIPIISCDEIIQIDTAFESNIDLDYGKIGFQCQIKLYISNSNLSRWIQVKKLSWIITHTLNQFWTEKSIHFNRDIENMEMTNFRLHFFLNQFINLASLRMLEFERQKIALIFANDSFTLESQSEQLQEKPGSARLC